MIVVEKIVVTVSRDGAVSGLLQLDDDFTDIIYVVTAL